MLKVEACLEIEVEQGQTFDVEIYCTNSDGEKSSGEWVWCIVIQYALCSFYQVFML